MYIVSFHQKRLFSVSHSGFRDSFVVFESLVVVDLVGMVRLVFPALHDSQETLVDADVLLLRLDHPDSLLSHLVDDPEDVHAVVLTDQLLQGNRQL